MEDNGQETAAGSNSKAKTIAWVAVIAAIALLYIAFTFINNDKPEVSQNISQDAARTAPAEQAPAAGTPAPASAPASEYKDGEYSAAGTYRTPEGTESVDVTLTVKDGVVTASEAATSGNNSTSVRYQDEFKANYKPLVVGKKIDDIQLSRVSGSSLTSGGFNQALDEIKDQAKG